MNGEMLLYGYRFPQKIRFNFLERTIFVSPHEQGLVHDIFDFLQRFFSKQDFSDTYLDRGLGLYLNDCPLHGNEYEVYRIPPLVHSAEVLKVLKKTLLGQLWQQMFCGRDAALEEVRQSLLMQVSSDLNRFLAPFHLQYRCAEEGILDFCKLMTLEALDGEEGIQLEESTQYDLKRLMLSAIGQLDTKRPKILLLEYPELGLYPAQVEQLFVMLRDVQVESVLIQTMDGRIAALCPSLYSYHYVHDGSICMFDDWDELLEAYPSASLEHIEQSLIQQLFSDKQSDELRKYIRNNDKIQFKN